MADAWKVEKEREGEKVRWGSAIVDDGGKKTEEDEFSILNRRTLDEIFEVEDRGVRHGLRGEGESVWRKRKRRRSRAMFFSLSLCFSFLFLFSKKKKSGEEKTNGFTLPTSSSLFSSPFERTESPGSLFICVVSRPLSRALAAEQRSPEERGRGLIRERETERDKNSSSPPFFLFSSGSIDSRLFLPSFVARHRHVLQLQGEGHR